VSFHFDEPLCSAEVIFKMFELGYKPANIWHLLYLSIRNPDIQRNFSVISLGSPCLLGGIYHVPCLPKKETGEYEIKLEWSGGDWNSSCRFVGVLK